MVDSLIDILTENFVERIPTGLTTYKIIYDISYKASRALLEIGHERGIEAMVLSILQKFGSPGKYGNPDPKDYIQVFLTETGKPVVKYLNQGLSLDNSQARVIAANCLGYIGNPTALEPLVRNSTAADAEY